METDIDITRRQTRIFNSIAIETAARCNRRCAFCPTSYFERPDEEMPLELFEKIIQDLVKARFRGRIELYIYNEPLRDKRMPALLEYVRKELKSACLMLNTNGDYIKSEEDILSLYEKGLNQLQINIYSKSEDSADIEKAKVREAKINHMVELIKDDANLIVDGDCYNNIGPRKRHIQVVPKYDIKKQEGTSISGGNKHGIHYISNRSGNIPGFAPALSKALPRPCVRPFRIFNIDWRGNAILCCNDYKSETAVGNAKDRDVIDLWNDHVMNVYRVKLQNRDRSIFFCDVCDFDGGYYTHLIQRVTFGKDFDQELLSSYIDRKSLFSD